MQGLELELQFLATDTTLLAAQVTYLDAEYDDFRYNTVEIPGFLFQRSGGQTGAPPGVVPPRTGCPFSGPAQIGGAPQYTIDCSGRTPPYAAEWSINIGIQQTFRLGGAGRIVADLHSRYSSAYELGVEYLASQRQDSYYMTDLALGYHTPDDRWSVTAYVNNIEDEPVLAGAFPHPLITDLTFGFLRPPRTYGVRLGVQF